MLVKRESVGAEGRVEGVGKVLEAIVLGVAVDRK